MIQFHTVNIGNYHKKNSNKGQQIKSDSPALFQQQLAIYDHALTGIVDDLHNNNNQFLSPVASSPKKEQQQPFIKSTNQLLNINVGEQNELKTRIYFNNNIIPNINEIFFKQSMINYLRRLNDNPNIIYYNDYVKTDGQIQLADGYNNIAHTSGFKYINGDVSYRYKGDNPSLALQLLLQHSPLFLECRSAINLCLILAFKEQIGDHLFNTYIKNKCDNTLNLSDKFVSNLPINMNLIQRYISFNSIKQSHISSINHNDIKLGNKIYIIIPHGLAFHPKSELNGYNLFCTGFNSDNEPLFLGFHSKPRVPYTLSEISKFLENAFIQNMTYSDLLYLMNNNTKKTIIPYSSYTYSEVYELLVKNNNFAKEASMAFLYAKNQNKLSQRSAIQIPEIIKEHTKCVLLDNYNITAKGTDKQSVVINYSLPVYSEQLDIEGYLPQNTTQIQLVNGLGAFQEQCIINSNKFNAFLVFGTPGTGKSHCCNQIIKELENQHNKKIWHTDHINSIPYTERIRYVFNKLIPMNYDHNTKIITTELLKIFANDWQNIDIFYLDGVNQDISTDAFIAIAALEYARQHHKQIIINSNFSPDKIGILKEGCLIGDIEILEIKGADYRENLPKWWNTNNPTNHNLTFSKDQYNYNFQISNTRQSPTIQQMELAKSIYIDLSKLEQLNQFGVICIFGKPGIGKTSLIKAMLHASNITYIRIAANDFNEEIFNCNNMDTDVIVFDDINYDISDWDKSKKVLRFVFNVDQLLNKYKKPVKIILISNESKFTNKILNITFEDEVSPRIKSRLSHLMKSYNTDNMTDFRLSSEKRGAFTGNINKEDIISSNNEIQANDVFELDFTQFNSKLARCSKNNQYDEMAAIKKEVIYNATKHKIIIITFDQFNFGGYTKSFFMPLLDYMEDNPNVRIYFQSSFCPPAELKDFIYNLFTNSLYFLSDIVKDKYISRLGRLLI